MAENLKVYEDMLTVDAHNDDGEMDVDNQITLPHNIQNQSKLRSKLVVDWSQFRLGQTGFGTSTELMLTGYAQFSSVFLVKYRIYDWLQFRFVCKYVRKLD